MRKVILVNTSDRGGGAERFTETLRLGLERRGVEAWLLVGDKKTDDPKVLPFFESPFVDYRPYANPRFQGKLDRLRSWDRSFGLESTRHPYARLLPSITGSPPDAVILVNLHGGFFDLSVLPWLSRTVPTLLVMQDCWTMTGHCAYPLSCERWRTGCGSCPDLARPPAIERDGTRLNWRRKRAIYAQSRLAVATCSRWVLDQAMQSILRPAIVESHVIPNGVDLEIFKPGSKRDARRLLGLDRHLDVVLFAAQQARSNPYKDYATMRKAIELLGGGGSARPLCFLAVGEEGPRERVGNAEIRHVPFLDSPKELATYYQAADLYVHAARGEAFGIVLAEALACGLPVVATAVGGIREVVHHARDGLLCPAGDARSMAKAMARLLEDCALRAFLAQNALRRARAELDQRRMVAAYHDVLKSLVADHFSRACVAA